MIVRLLIGVLCIGCLAFSLPWKNWELEEPEKPTVITADELIVYKPIKNGNNVVELTAVAPDGTNITIQGWIKIKVQDQDRFIPFW